MHRAFKEIGKILASTWGRDDDGDFDALVKSISPEKQAVCVLAYIVDEVGKLNRKMDLLLDPAECRRVAAERKAKEEEEAERRARRAAWGQANKEQAARWVAWLRPYVRARFAQLRESVDGEVFRKVRGCAVNTLWYAERHSSPREAQHVVAVFKAREPQDWKVDALRGIGPTYKQRWQDLFAGAPTEADGSNGETEAAQTADTPA